MRSVSLFVVIDDGLGLMVGINILLNEMMGLGLLLHSSLHGHKALLVEELLNDFIILHTLCNARHGLVAL